MNLPSWKQLHHMLKRYYCQIELKSNSPDKINNKSTNFEDYLKTIGDLETNKGQVRLKGKLIASIIFSYIHPYQSILNLFHCFFTYSGSFSIFWPIDYHL